MNDLNDRKKILVYLKFAVRNLFLLLVFSLALMQLFVSLGGQRIQITDILFLPLFGLWLAAIVTGALPFKFHRYYNFFIFYLVVSFISALFSGDSSHSLFKFTGEVYLICLAVVAHNLVRSTEDFHKLVKFWLAGIVVAVAVGLATLISFYLFPGNRLLIYTTHHYGAVPVGNFPRLSSTFISASMFCNYLNVSLLLLLLAGKLKIIGRTFFKLLLAAVAVCSVMTISAGIGGVILAAAMWFRDQRETNNNRSEKSLVLTGATLIAAGLFAVNFVALQAHSTAPFSVGVPLTDWRIYPSARLMIWSETLKTFGSNFLTGVGTGEDVCRVTFENTDKTFSVLTDAHNILLSVAAQNGVFGLIAIVVITGAILFLYLFPKPHRAEVSLIQTTLLTAFICAFCYQGLTGAFEDARHLWVLIGLILAFDSIDER